jgi:hypothetical protein
MPGGLVDAIVDFIGVVVVCVLFAATMAALELVMDLGPLLVRRKVRRAGWRHLSGVRGRRGRRAWRQLMSARSSDHAMLADALWPSWIRDPDDDGWALLCRWRPAQARADLIAAATTVAVSTARHPGGGPRAALPAFCARHGLAPDDPAERVRFHVLTGQAQQRRALDPDGAVLAAAYRTAEPLMRAALREGLAGEGDLDALRLVVAGTRTAPRAADMTADERDYLTGQLASRRDWATLLDLAKELPAAEAAAAAALIDPGWRPDRQRDRELLAMLTEIAPAPLRYARAALGSAGPARIEVPGRVVAGALSAGGERLAVATVDADPDAVVISRYGLPGGRLVARHRIPRCDVTALVYTGARELIVVAASASDYLPADATRMYHLGAGHRARLVARENTGTLAAVACRRGFATVSAHGFLHAYHAPGRLPAPGMWLGWSLFRDFSVTSACAAAHLASGRIAVTSTSRAGEHLLLMLDMRREAGVHSVRIQLPATAGGVCFHDREHVIVASPGHVQRWEVNGWDDYRCTIIGSLRGARDLVLVSGRDEVCALDDSGAVSYLRARSLEVVHAPRGLSGMRGTALWGAAGSASHALGGDGAVHVVTGELLALQELADRPMTAWQPADAGTLARAEAVVARCPAARPPGRCTVCWPGAWSSGSEMMSGSVTAGLAASPAVMTSPSRLPGRAGSRRCPRGRGRSGSPGTVRPVNHEPGLSLRCRPRSPGCSGRIRRAR